MYVESVAHSLKFMRQIFSTVEKFCLQVFRKKFICSYSLFSKPYCCHASPIDETYGFVTLKVEPNLSVYASISLYNSLYEECPRTVWIWSAMKETTIHSSLPVILWSLHNLSHTIGNFIDTDGTRTPAGIALAIVNMSAEIKCWVNFPLGTLQFLVNSGTTISRCWVNDINIGILLFFNINLISENKYWANSILENAVYMTAIKIW